MNYHRILATQTGGWIGDMVLLDPALRALRRRHTESHITLQVRPAVASLMERHPAVDDVIATDRRAGDKGPGALWREARRIRAGRFDAMIVWHPTSVRSAVLGSLARVPVRVGHRIGGRGLFLTRSVRDDPAHETERYVRIVPLLNGPDDDCHDPEPRFWHGDADRSTVSELMGQHDIDDGEPTVCLHLGTTWPTKEWSADMFAVVARNLLGLGVRIVITGADEDMRIRDAFATAMAGEPYTDLVGVCDLLQLGALLERCNVCVTADSGPMHIAAAVGTPVVGMFGPTSPRRHGPVGKGHVVLQEALPCVPCYKPTCGIADRFLCMRSIDPSRVSAAAARLVAGPSR